MPEIVNYNKDLHLIEVRSYGLTTQEQWEASISEIIQISTDKGCKKVLADIIEIEHAIPIEDIYKVANEVLPSYLSYAILTKEDNPVDTATRFLETTSLTNGISMAIFNDRENAIKWLKV